MATKTTKIDCEVEVLSYEVQPPSMNPKLLEAARLGDMKILDELLQAKDFSTGASLSEIAIIVPKHDATQEDTNWLHGVTCEGNTAFHIVASRGHLEFAKKICRQEISLLTATNKRLDTPLHCAARTGNDRIVSHIIELAREGKIEKEAVLRAINKNKNNALHEAAKYNHMHVAKVLMEEDAELASMLNDVSMSPLYLAIVSGSLKVAKELLQFPFWSKASPESYQGPNNQTALHAAVLISQEITRELLDRKPTLANCVDSFGRIPLHCASSDGHHNTVKLLLECVPTTAYNPNAQGIFPIHLAARTGNVHVVDEILEQCPDTEELLDKQGRNFLHTAIQFEKLDVVKKLISKRPDLRKMLNDQDNQGNTPLHTAVKNQDQRSVHFLLRDKTVHINVISHDGFTPLDLAYANLDCGLFFRANVARCIFITLAFTNALPGLSPYKYESDMVLSCHVGEGKEKPTSGKNKKKPFGDDEVQKKSSNDKEEEPHVAGEGKKKPTSDKDKKKPSCDDEVKKNSPSNVEKEKMKRQHDEEMRKWADASKNLGIATALIATVTFTAGFTVPGGYVADDHPDRGTAVLAKEYAFKVFVVSNAFAFVCSFLATYWFIGAGTSTVDQYTRQRHLNFARECLWVAFSSMFTAFAMGVYATLVPSYKSISILLCIMALGTPILAQVVSTYNLYHFRATVGIRQGSRHWIWPTTIYPHVENILRSRSMPPEAIIRSMLLILGSYAVFFLLPKLFASKN